MINKSRMTDFRQSKEAWLEIIKKGETLFHVVHYVFFNIFFSSNTRHSKAHNSSISNDTMSVMEGWCITEEAQFCIGNAHWHLFSSLNHFLQENINVPIISTVAHFDAYLVICVILLSSEWSRMQLNNESIETMVF